MEPLYKEGEVVWVFHWAYLLGRPKIRDIVVFRNRKLNLLKRVSEVSNNFIKVKGDNKKDSLEIGEIKYSQIVGRVVQK